MPHSMIYAMAGVLEDQITICGAGYDRLADRTMTGQSDHSWRTNF